MIVEQRDYVLVPGGAPLYLDFAVFRGKVRGLLLSQANRVLLPAAPTEGLPPR